VPLTAAQMAVYTEAMQVVQMARFVALGTLPGSDLTNVRVSIQNISESRNSSNTAVGGGTTSIGLSLSGEGLPAISVLRQANVTKALDDQDRVYPAGRGGTFTFSAMSLSNSLGRGARGGLTANAQLGAAPRSVTAIKLLEGTLDLVVPTEANGGIIRIPGIKLHSGRLEHPELTKRGIAVVFATDQESYDEAVNLRATIFRGTIGGAPVIPDGKTNFTLYYQDPSGAAMGALLQDGKGAALPTRSANGSSSSGNWAMMNLTLDAGLPDDAQLVVFVATPESIKKVPFRFENVPLP
jgi:hypothetical protein